MSYPEPVYAGDGEVSARVRSVRTAPELPRSNGAASFLATGASTGGRFGLYRWDMGPEPAGAEPHFHRTFSESFFVVSGAVELYDGKGWAEAEPGDFAYVPEGGLHGFRNLSGADAVLLILFSPGAPREAYFQGLADRAAGRWDPSEDELLAFYEEHDNHYV